MFLEYGHTFDYNKRVPTKLIYAIPLRRHHKLSRNTRGSYQACYDEVVAEATDTGDLPMYGQQMLNQSAQWKFDEFMSDIEKMVGVK